MTTSFFLGAELSKDISKPSEKTESLLAATAVGDLTSVSTPFAWLVEHPGS